MPRRKVTRAKAPLNIPEIPGLAITEEMSMEERKEQLEIYMKDFHFKSEWKTRSRSRSRI